eukprot:TRINITY_DN18236_c0_g1_i1.p1 TRINITY_DN18236_c0_g1~~TRINITY_DN18236_c0_g1_i1.p1  ORF type:complete len:347 (+),score=56.25 TRINITY_DN18236_c0_g1_i1:104-1144(+)
MFKSSRDLLLSAIITATVASTINHLAGFAATERTSLSFTTADADATSITLSVAIWRSLWVFAAIWCALFVTSPFPSQRWFNKSRLHALGFALLYLFINDLTVVGAGALSQSLASFGLWLVQMLLLAFCWKRSAHSLQPPSPRVFLESFKRVFCNALPNQEFWRVELRPEDRSCPGCLTLTATFAWTCNLLLTCIEKALRSQLPSNQDSAYVQEVMSNDCASIDGYSQSLVDAFRFMSCFGSIYYSIFPFFFAPALYIDLMIHQRHWQGSTQFALVDKFAELPWHKFQFRADEWRTIELLAAGMEGEIHLAELTLQREEGARRKIVVKIPHVDGLGGWTMCCRRPRR